MKFREANKSDKEFILNANKEINTYYKMIERID